MRLRSGPSTGRARPLQRRPQSAPAASAEFFEARVRPVLAANCYDCHADERMGGLRLDSREALLKGGRSGAGDRARRSRQEPADPGRPADQRQAEDAEGRAAASPTRSRRSTEWVQAGAAWPASAAPLRRRRRPAAARRRRPRSAATGPPHRRTSSSRSSARSGRSSRSASRRRRPCRTPSWAKTDIDRFVLARLEKEGLTPVRAADKRTLIRRATLDLTGLPPTPEEIDAFEKDDVARRVREGRRSAARVAALRRNVGPHLARRRALRRGRLPLARSEGPRPQPVSERLSVSRLGDQGVQRRPAVRPVRARAARRRSAGRRRGARAHAAGARLPRPRAVVLRQRRRRDHARRRAPRSRRRRVARLPRPDRRLRPLPRPQVRSDSDDRLLLAGRRLPEHVLPRVPARAEGRRRRVQRSRTRRSRRRRSCSRSSRRPSRRSWPRRSRCRRRSTWSRRGR